MFSERAEIERLRDRLYEVEQRIEWLMTRAGNDEKLASLGEAVSEALRDRGFIDAVMLYRRRTGGGLAEGQQYVDRLRRKGEAANDDESADVPHDQLDAVESTDVPGATEAGSVGETDAQAWFNTGS